MPIKYTNHAMERMVERMISTNEVEYVLDQFHTSYPDGPKTILIGAPEGRRIKVVTAPGTDDDVIIITVAD